MTIAPAPQIVRAPESRDPFATFKCNRWPYTPAARIANSVRIAVVGDSMVYGQGVPYTQTLGPRLARHLNVARPGLWFDCQSFGQPGACAFHALSRVETLAAAIDPDLVIIGLTQNDALMLRPQPDEARTGQSWVDFAPHLRAALTGFIARWRNSGHRAPVAVLYFDSCTDLAGIRPADVLRVVCEDAGLLFVDGSEPLAGRPARGWWVSPNDGHLNAEAHDLVARQLARTILSQSWLPASADYDDPAWLDSIAHAADSLIDADLPAAIAASEAINTLQIKWLDRRNRSRSAHQSQYQAIVSRLRERAGREWPAVVLRSFERDLGQLPSISLQISDVEDHVYRANTLTYALRFAAESGGLGQPLEGLLSRWVDGERFTIDDIEPARLRAEARAARATAIIEAARSAETRQVECRGLAAMAAHARGTNLAAARGLAGFQALRCESLPASFEVQRVLHDALALWRLVDAVLSDADLRTSWPAVAPLLSDFAPDRATMTLTLNVLAAPGPEQWVYRVGIYSPAQSVHESYVATGWLNRDGRPNAYAIDLPLLVSSTITLNISGDGFGSNAPADVLRVLPARLDVPGLPPLEFRLSRATRHSETTCAIEFTPNLFQRPA